MVRLGHVPKRKWFSSEGRAMNVATIQVDCSYIFGGNISWDGEL